VGDGTQLYTLPGLSLSPHSGAAHHCRMPTACTFKHLGSMQDVTIAGAGLHLEACRVAWLPAGGLSGQPTYLLIDSGSCGYCTSSSASSYGYLPL